MNGGGAVGVTGLPCSGKSLAAELLAGGEIDGQPRLLLKADDLGHALLLRPDVLARLRGRFGAAAADAADPAAMRRAIAAKVFADAAELEWLESVIHPLVTAETIRRAGEAGGRVVVESALLFAPGAAGMRDFCGVVLVVDAPFAVRLARAARRGWDESELRRREARLLPLFAAAEKKSGTKRVRIDNSGSIEALRSSLCAALARRNPA